MRTISYKMIQQILFLCSLLLVVFPGLLAAWGLLKHFLLGYDGYIYYYYYYSTIYIPIKYFLLILSFILLVLCLERNYKLNKSAILHQPNILFFLFVALIIISTLKNGITEAAIIGVGEKHESIFTYIEYILLYYCICSTITSTKQINITALIYSVASIPVAIYAYWFYEQYPNGTTLTGIFNNSNEYGYYLSIAIILSGGMFIISSKKYTSIFYILVYVLNALTLMYNNTLGAWIACVITLIFLLATLCFTREKTSLKTTLILLLFITITIITSFCGSLILSSYFSIFDDVNKISKHSVDAGTAGSGRWAIWKKTVEYIYQKPFLGWGVEGISNNLSKHVGNPRPHCEPLQYAAFFGLPALLIYISAYVSVLIISLRKIKTADKLLVVSLATIISYFMSSLFGNTYYYTTPYFFIFLGFCTSLSHSKKESV